MSWLLPGRCGLSTHETHHGAAMGRCGLNCCPESSGLVLVVTGPLRPFYTRNTPWGGHGPVRFELLPRKFRPCLGWRRAVAAFLHTEHNMGGHGPVRIELLTRNPTGPWLSPTESQREFNNRLWLHRLGTKADYTTHLENPCVTRVFFDGSDRRLQGGAWRTRSTGIFHHSVVHTHAQTRIHAMCG